jgi:hypothetical protein
VERIIVSSVPRKERSNQQPKPCMMARDPFSSEEQGERVKVRTCAIDSKAVRDFKVLQFLTSDGAEVNTMNRSRIRDQTLRREET